MTVRRSPWPYDMRIDGVGVRLKPLTDQGGILVAKKLETLQNVAPTEFSYTAQSPFGERTYPFRRPMLGLGERVQDGPVARQYRYAINADLSIGGYMMLGPAVTTHTPSTTGAGQFFVEALHSGTRTLFYAAGRYMLRRDGDTTWAVSKDFGAGRTIRSAVRYKHQGVGAVDALYVTLDNGELWRYDGSTWSGPASGITRHVLAVWGDELWGSDGNLLRKVTADPMTAANWSGAYVIGSGETSINALAVLQNQLFIFTDTGKVFTLNTAGSDIELFQLATTPSSRYGVNLASWAGALYVPAGDGLYRITGGDVATLEGIGPERLLENDSPVRGRVVAFAGHSTWFGYAALYNQLNGNSYLLKYGAWLNPDERGDFQFAPVWHGAIAEFQSAEVTCLFISDIPGPNPRLYIGFASGSLAYIILPRGSPDPRTDANCRFATSGTIYWPLHHAMFQADAKSFRGFTVFGETVNANQTVTIQYRTDLTQAYTTLTPSFTVSGQRIELPSNTYGKIIDVAVQLQTNDQTKTPNVETVALHEAVRPAMRMVYEFTVLARHRMPLYNGQVDSTSAETIRQTVRDAAAREGTTQLLFTDGEEQEVSVESYAEVLSTRAQISGLAWEIPVRAVQYRTHTLYGTIERLKPYTVGDLAPYTIAQLGVL